MTNSASGNAVLSTYLGHFLVALAGVDKVAVSNLAGLIATSCQSGFDYPISLSVDAAAALYLGRPAAQGAERDTWTKALVAVETILENELARLDRAAPASGEEV